MKEDAYHAGKGKRHALSRYQQRLGILSQGTVNVLLLPMFSFMLTSTNVAITNGDDIVVNVEIGCH